MSYLFQESDSSCEQSSLLTDLSLDPLDSGRSDNSIDDGHSPFIPIADELPVLEPAVMWGALPDNVSMARPQPSEAQNASPAPALQRLLAAPPTGPPPQDLITNIYSDQGNWNTVDFFYYKGILCFYLCIDCDDCFRPYTKQKRTIMGNGSEESNEAGGGTEGEAREA